MSTNLLNLPAALGALVLKWATAKYIEAAGATSVEMTERAKSLKALATAADGVALGTTTLAQLSAVAAADISKGSVSNQILVSGLLSLIGSALPTGDLLTAALGAEANVFLQDVIAVCTTFGA
jgi:hypothetical protein